MPSLQQNIRSELAAAQFSPNNDPNFERPNAIEFQNAWDTKTQAIPFSGVETSRVATWPWDRCE
jgi:hypothetical protein